ncbi:MAG: response regulator transcription factor [Chloroflexi bacterium]|nr:response regulator transcription factor [Chloroflexota bacterium]
MISRQRILIIDDDPHITRILQVILEEAGFETIGATDGKDGLEKVFAQRPDLVLLDIRMPVMDGNIFRQRLREMTKTIPIILVTALTDPDSKAQNLEGGADDYITKPFERRELIARVRAVLRRNATLVSAPRAFYKDAQLRIDFPGYQIWVDSHAIELTPKEWRVLAFAIFKPNARAATVLNRMCLSH